VFLGEYLRDEEVRMQIYQESLMRPSSLMQWWGAAAKMVIPNINIKVLTIVFTGLVSLVATKGIGEHGFSWKWESLGLESLCLVNTGSVCLRRNAGAVKDQEGGVKEVVTYSMPRSRGSTTPTSSWWR